MQAIDKEIGTLQVFNQREDRNGGFNAPYAEIDETKDKFTDITSV